MRTKSILLLAQALAVIPVVRASAQGLATSAPITDIRYDVTFTRANGERRQVSSAMTFTVGGTEPVLLSLPEWTPGAYGIDNFARNVANFAAEEAGTALSRDKIDPETWRVPPRGLGTARVRLDSA